MIMFQNLNPIFFKLTRNRENLFTRQTFLKTDLTDFFKIT